MGAFESLSKKLNEWFDKPIDELPEPTRELVIRHFPSASQGDFPINPKVGPLAVRSGSAWDLLDPNTLRPLPVQARSAWNFFTPEQRREFARQWDYLHDPANAREQEVWLYSGDIEMDLERRLEAVSQGPCADAAGRDKRIEDLNRRLGEVGREREKLLTAERDELPTVLEQVSKRLAAIAAGQLDAAPQPTTAAPAASITILNVLQIGSEDTAGTSSTSHDPMANQTVPEPVSAEPLIKKKRKSNGRDYGPVDEPLLAEMHTLIKGGEATSGEAAALRVADRAAGSNTKLESKVKRLAKHYREHPKYGGLDTCQLR